VAYPVSLRSLPCAALLLFCCLPAQPATDNNFPLWFNYVGEHPLGRKSPWSLILEGQYRRADLGLRPQQVIGRTGLTYKVTPKLALSAAYTFSRNHPYGEFPAPYGTTEHRLSEHLTFTQPLGRLSLQNRLRMEQREISVLARQRDNSLQISGWRYQNRFRYQARTSIALPWAERKYFIGLADEIFINFGKNIIANVFDQNRVTVTLGRNFSGATRVEVGMTEQTLQQRGGQVFEHNHIMLIAVYSKLPFGR
jgi:hypothetical protein